MVVSEKIAEVLKKLEGKNIYYVFIGVLVVIFLLDYFIIMGPQLSALSKVSGEVKALSTQVTNTETAIQRLNTYRQQIKTLKKDIQEENLKVTLKDDVPLVLAEISRVAIANHFQINQIMPDVSQEQLLLEDKERRYFRLPVLIEAQSSYHNFGRFLNKIENLETILNIDTFSVVAGRQGKLHKIKIKLSMIMFEKVKEKEL